MAGQVGKGAKFYRGTTPIIKCITINPPIATIAKVDTTNLDSTAKEYVASLPDYPEIEVKILRVFGDGPQDQLEVDFANADNPVEAWKYEARDPITDAVLKTYSFNGYISGCSSGPYEVEARVEMSLKVQLSGTVTVS